MKKKEPRFLKRPLVLALALPLFGLLIVSILALFIDPLIRAVFPSFASSAEDVANASSSVARCIFALIVVLIVKRRGRTFRFRFDRDSCKRSLLLSLFAMVHVANNIIEGFLFSDGLRSTLGGIISAILIGLGAGLFEEVICRGIVLSNMMDKWREKKQRILLSVLVSGVAFGLLHLLNLAQYSVLWVLLQIFTAAGVGILFGAVYVRTRSIMGPIIMHSLMDTVYFLFIFPAVVATKDYIIGLIVTFFFIFAGLYLIRPAKHGEINALWDEQPVEAA